MRDHEFKTQGRLTQGHDSQLNQHFQTLDPVLWMDSLYLLVLFLGELAL